MNCIICGKEMMYDSFSARYNCNPDSLASADVKNLYHAYYYFIKNEEQLIYFDYICVDTYSGKVSDANYYRLLVLKGEPLMNWWEFVCYLPKSIMDKPEKLFERVKTFVVFS